ncbi:Uncharacterised protein [Mycobacteroides abscessus subsp. abscessus]|uniref:hypothetical protein n=1 Tax=Mycobacteroides abscessus TaxID=36809 RepID=UPI000927C49B|nr:hypothetical protein [Mycobacteroides abscessus]SIH21588.1 Uncharacterised protein [Mycobacteroides abscessus subsp. abscessus]
MSVSEADRKRLGAQLDEFLTNRALTETDLASLADSMAAELIPASPQPPRRAAAAAPPPPQAAAAAWAPKDNPDTPDLFSLITDDELAIPTSSGPARQYIPGPPPPAVPLASDDDEDGWVQQQRAQNQDRWEPPRLDPVDIPEDMDAITPVTDIEFAEEEQDLVPEPHPPIDDEPKPGNDSTSEGPRGQRLAAATRMLGVVRRAISARWARLPRPAKIGLPTFAAIIVIVALAIGLTGEDNKTKLIDGPEAAPVNETPSVTTKNDVLNPPRDGFQNNCPSGSTDPIEAFLPEASSAFRCPILFGYTAGGFVLTFNSPVTICSIHVVPGWNYSETNKRSHWEEQRLVTRILWTIGGQSFVQEIPNPTAAGATLDIPCVSTVQVVMAVQDSTPPPKVRRGPLGAGIGGPNQDSIDKWWAIGKITIWGHQSGGTA